MWIFLLRRLLNALPVMLVVSLVVFGLIYISPGDPAAIIAGEFATADEVINIRARLGLDEAFLVRYGKWALRVMSGDLGVSIFSNFEVSTLIGQRIGPTLALTAATLVWALAFALPLGIIAAVRARRLSDRFVMALSVVGFSAPSFVIGYVLMYAFSVRLGWFPVQGYEPIANGVVEFLRHIFLPSLTLGLVYMALIARMTRASLIDVLSQDFIRTANAKGLSWFSVVLIHALRNAAVPIVTTIGAGVALLIGGVVITETVFGIPGLGRLTVDAILRRDYPIIQGVLLLFSLAYVVINLVVDIVYVIVDPRIRY
jgi:peptide/nickel transport system permease protein